MSGWIAITIGGIIGVLWEVLLHSDPRPSARQPPDRSTMLKKTDDPALYLDRQLRVLGVTVFWLATIATFGMMALSAVFGLGGLSVVLGLTFGLGVGGVVYGVEGNRLSAKERRKTEEQLRHVRRADENRALGRRYASIVEPTRATVSDIRYSEAARSGLLGDIDFNADIRGITDNLLKAHELENVADTLAALDKPSADDRRILAEAKTTVAKLETAALNRVELIDKCAAEAKLIDKSLHEERQDATTSAQRAELHAKLAAMLYGIEATPDTTPTESAVDAVLMRVQAYREIKNQIRLGRD